MAGGPAKDRLLSSKAELIDILSADPDFLLQHAHSGALLSPSAYKRIKAVSDPSGQVRDVLDHVLEGGRPEEAQDLLDLLESPAFRETFPRLKDLRMEARSKRKSEDLRRPVVTERQLMKVARQVGLSWRSIGIEALEIPNVKLEQLEADHKLHVDQVFHMLCFWQCRERDKATAATLHRLLTQDDWALPVKAVDFLLDS